MEINKQNQVAGDNSQQLQVGSIGNLTIVNGITEQRAREIFREMNRQSIANYTQDAYEEALRRISMLENSLMQRAEEVEGIIEAFGNPAFQILLAEAQKRAAATEREADYDLLSELLVCHVQKAEDRIKRTSVNRAVEIVGDIDAAALCGLSVAYAKNRIWPTAGDITKGLCVLNNLFDKLIYEKLPTGSDWLDHLDVLGVVRLSSAKNTTRIYDYYANRLNGYVCTGIKKNSKEHMEAIETLAAVEIDRELLVENECLDDYVRLNICSISSVSNASFYYFAQKEPYSDKQIEAIKRVWEMYTKEDSLRRQVRKSFAEKWDSYKALSALKLWYESIQYRFHITQVGEIMAYTNAKRCFPNIPIPIE